MNPTNRKALVIGINRYPELNDGHLKVSADDAEAIAQLLGTYGHFHPIYRFPEGFLQDRGDLYPCVAPTHDLNNFTTEDLKTAIEKLFKPQTDIPHTALLFFAGHGLFNDNGKLVLATSEAGYPNQEWGISLEWLCGLLKDSPVKQQIVWLDCCYSGEWIELAKTQLHNSDKQLFFITATTSYESAFADDKHGILTKIILEGLDPSKDSYEGLITHTKLERFIKTNPPKIAQKILVYSSSNSEIHLTCTEKYKLRSLILESNYERSQTQPTNQKSDVPSNNSTAGSDIKILYNALTKLDYSKAQAKSSSVRLIPSPNKETVRDLLIIDPEIARAWSESPQNIVIYEDQTLASLKNVRWIESKDLFLPEFIFVDLEDALPGAFLPDGTQINFNGQRITPLIPLNPILLDYLTPEDLIKKIKFTPINGSEGPLVRVIIDLPLSGLKNNDKQPQNYHIYKDYPIKEENALTEVPVLEVWPRFRAEGWKEYYAFYYDGEYGEETFQVSLPEAKEPHIFREVRGSYQITRLEKFPSFINCQDQARNTIGLILLKTPENIKLNAASWTVGVDFGTSFTNVYVNNKGIVEPLLLENLHLKIAEANIDTRNPVMFEHFIPERFIPLEKPLPLASVLTTRGKPNTKAGQERPIYDGRIYIPGWNSFNSENSWIETDLKWENLTLNRLFLKHLALHISALAAKNGVKQIQWSISYPSAFSNSDRAKYVQTWQNLTQELQEKTGIIHNSPVLNNLDYFRTESLAFAQYFADLEDLSLVNATCIDMGGGTSDISIWENNKLVHQCSIQLAGRDLFSQFLELKPEFLDQNLQLNNWGFKHLKGRFFITALDHFLRMNSDYWLKNQRIFVEDNSEFQGLLRLIAIGFSGLYYYVGTILGVLHDEGKYRRREITPVYIGGNGSRLLNWLAIGGQFDRDSEVNHLLSRMLSAGSGFDDIGEITRLSQRPKDEVCCGLVLSSTKLQGLTKRTKDPLIAGEDCEVNGNLISWRDRLELEGNIEQFQIPEFEQLSKFLDEFNLALKELEIEGLKPMRGFKAGVGLEADYSERLWRETKRELTRVTLTIKGESDNIRVEPPFILGLKALLRVLGKEWAGK